MTHLNILSLETEQISILCLYSVASCQMVKMPISNLSKIFGPTVLGYSSLEPDQHAIFTETMIQAEVR